MVGNLDRTKGTRCVPYSLIAVHEEAGDEGANAQLIADIIRLRYRDTSLTLSSKTTRTLPKTESWLAAWPEFFFRSTLELLLDVMDEDGRTACSARNGIDGRDALVAKWPRLARGKTRVVAMSSSDGNGAFPFITTARLQRSFNHPGIRCRQHGAQQGQPVRSQRREHGCGKRWRGGVTASYGCDTDDDEVQRPKELTMMGERREKLSVRCFTFAIETKRSVAKSFDRSWSTSLLDSEDLKVMSTDQE
jgi:hypothetical protein